jgi:predicted  nucleic acid-binding Zn-ribbon protein
MSNETLERIESKLDLLLNSKKHRINEKRYITAKEVEDLTGLNHRTILNRSNLDNQNPRFIPSIQFGGSRRKYFERKVTERIFRLS